MTDGYEELHSPKSTAKAAEKGPKPQQKRIVFQPSICGGIARSWLSKPPTSTIF